MSRKILLWVVSFCVMATAHASNRHDHMRLLFPVDCFYSTEELRAHTWQTIQTERATAESLLQHLYQNYDDIHSDIFDINNVVFNIHYTYLIKKIIIQFLLKLKLFDIRTG